MHFHRKKNKIKKRMQRLLPVTWTDTSCSAIFSSEYDHTAPGTPSITRGVIHGRLNLKFEIFSENRKTDAGGDNKL